MSSKWFYQFKRPVPLSHCLAIGFSYTQQSKKYFGFDFKRVIFVFENGLETSYRLKEDRERFKKFFTKVLLKDKSFFDKIEKIYDLIQGFYFNTIKEIKEASSEFSLKRLAGLYRKFLKSEEKVTVLIQFPLYLGQYLPSNITKDYQKPIIKLAKWRDKISKFLYQAYNSNLWRLLNKISKKLKINIQPHLLQYLSFPEISSLYKMSENKLKKLKASLEERYKFSVLEVGQRDFKLYLGKDASRFLGQEDIISKKGLAISVFKGLVAFKKPEKIRGRTRIVFNDNDCKKIKNNEILVTPMTGPTYVPYLKKVKAIITDEGGLTCHAAIVARELNKPCIIGTKIATKVLHDGDLVEVDANKGIVKIFPPKADQPKAEKNK